MLGYICFMVEVHIDCMVYKGIYGYEYCRKKRVGEETRGQKNEWAKKRVGEKTGKKMHGR